MQIYVSEELEESFFQERAVEVLYKIEGEEEIDFNLIVIEEEKDCEGIFEEVPVEKKKKFAEQCKETSASTSFKVGGQEFVIIKVDKEFLKENERACRGLIAHELMHTIQRNKGLERKIENSAFSKVEDFIGQFEEKGFTHEVAQRILISVMKTAIFCLKDIFANTEIIKQSFIKDLEEYYYLELGLDEFCPKPDFYGEEVEMNEVVKAIKFELQLMPSWLPFEVMEKGKRGKIRSKIEDYYEANIKQVAYHIHKLRDSYHDKYEDTDKFIDTFFEEVFEAFEKTIEEKLG